MAAHEEQDQNTGAGVGADDGTYIACGDFLDVVLCTKGGFQGCCILGAVAVTDEHGIKIRAGFGELLYQMVNGIVP